MYGYPDYRNFHVQRFELRDDVPNERVQNGVRQVFPSNEAIVRDLCARLQARTTILTAQRGCIRIATSATHPMDAYESLLDAIDELTDPYALRRVDRLN